MISSSVTSLSAKLCNGNAIVSKTGPISAGVFNFVFFNYCSIALAAIAAGVQHKISSERACVPTHTRVYRLPKITSPGTILRICYSDRFETSIRRACVKTCIWRRSFRRKIKLFFSSPRGNRFSKKCS